MTPDAHTDRSSIPPAGERVASGRTSTAVWNTTAARTAGRSALVAALIMCLTHCSGTRGGVSTDTVRSDVSGCAAVLPIARASVHARAQLLHVMPVSRRTAARLVGPFSIVNSSGDSLRGHLCLVAYRGHFSVRDIHGVRQQSGKYALLVLTVHHPRVVGAVLESSLPDLD